MNMAPVSIKLACLRIAGIAMLPTADAPVRNFAAFIQLGPKNKTKKKQQREISSKIISSYTLVKQS